MGPRAACRRAGKRSGDPRRGAVGRRRAVAGGDRLGRGRTPQAGGDRPRGRAPCTRLSGRLSGAAAITVSARRDRDSRAGTGALADGPLAGGLPTLPTAACPSRWSSSAARAHAVVVSVLTPAEVLIAARRLAGVDVHIDGWDIRGPWFGVVVRATPRTGEQPTCGDTRILL